MRRAGQVAFILGAIGLAVLVSYADVAQIAAALSALGLTGLVYISLLHLPVLALLGLAWWFIGRDLPGAVPWKFMWARYVRESAGEVLPFSQVGGFVIGARALVLTGLRTIPVSVSMLTDLVMELTAKLPYLAAGLIVLFMIAPGGGLPAPLFTAFGLSVAGLLLVAVFHKRVTRVLERAAIALAHRWPALGLDSAGEVKPAFDRLFARDSRIMLGFATHLMCWGFGALETWVIFHLIGIPVTVLEALVIDSLVSALRTAGFVVPANLGVQEGGYVLVCGLFGISPAVAVALSLVRRAREYVIGIPGLVAWQAVEGRRAFAARLPRTNPSAGPTTRPH